MRFVYLCVSFNFMKNFKIKASSWVIYLITFFVIMFFGSLLGFQIIPRNNNDVEVVILFIILLSLSILITRFAGNAMTEWTITKNDIQLKWVEQFIFHKRPDLTIKWDEIKGYQVNRMGRTFDLFKLVLFNGRVIKLWHGNFITKDDFERFLVYFEEKVQAHNEAEIKNKK